MSRSIVMASGKGGVGKTTLAANLGVALSIYGKKTIVLDADVAMANLELVLGMEGKPVTLHTVLSEEASIEEAIYEGQYGMKIVPAGISLETLRKIKLDRLDEVVDKLVENSDIVLIDAAAAWGEYSLTAIATAQEMILVITPDPSSISDARKTKTIADELGVEIIGVVINRDPNDETSLIAKDIGNFLEVPIISVIPENLDVSRATASKEPLLTKYPNSPVSKAIMQLAADLIGEKYQPPNPDNNVNNSITMKDGQEE
jgi:septum site-determining protein MinD